MADLNNVIVTGRFTAKPEVKTTGESRYVRFNLACERRKGKDEEKAKTDFPSFIAWNGIADTISKYCGKGDEITAVGRIQTGSYEKDGTKIYTTDVVVEGFYFGRKAKRDDNATPEATPVAEPAAEALGEEETIVLDVSSDELPF